MKKILTILTILMMAVTGRVSADDHVFHVGDAYDFIQALKTETATIILVDDIDLSDHDGSNGCIYDGCFSGKIDGGYTDANGNKRRHKLMNSKKDLLFNYLENAEISNLIIENCSFNGWDTHSGWLGTEAKYCKFTDIELVNCSGTGDSYTHDIDDIGGLVGVSKHCTFTRVYSINSSIETDGERAGLIVGKDEYSTFTNCVTGPTSSIWADGNANNAYCGGICGDATGSTLTDCVNMALVCSKDDRTGGVIGFGNNTKLYNCINSGIVCNAEKSNYNTVKSTLVAEVSSLVELSLAGAGVSLPFIGFGYFMASISVGVWPSTFIAGNVSYFFDGEAGLFEALGANGADIAVGSMTKYTLLSGLAQTAAVCAIITAGVLTGYALYNDFYKADEVGGIAGKLDNNSVADRCINLGGVECADVECGGIVGYLDGSTVKNCLNRGMVRGEDRTGGVAGYCNNNSVLEGNINTSGFNALGGNGGYIYDEDSHGDLTARNNYYVSGTTIDKGNGCIGETPANFATGQVALTLNELAGDTIWHQNLGEAMYPVPCAGVPLVTKTTDSPATVEKISSPGEFVIAVSNPWAVVSLEADLDMSGQQCANLSSQDSPFRGKIYGNGHKISNFSYQVPYCSTDHKDSNTGIFQFAEGAEFHNFTIENFHFTQKGLPTIVNKETHQQIEALLVAQSTNCIYDSIAIKKSSIYKNNKQRKIAGMVAVSNYDTFTNCSVDEQCRFEALTGDDMNDALVAGIAAVAKGSKFSYCYGAPSIWSDDNKAAAIVGELKDGSIDHCFSSGTINSHERVAGIAGYAENTPITYCVNTALIADGKDTRQDWRGGIVGQLKGSGAYKAYNLNFGTLNYMAPKCEAIGKLDDGAQDKGHNYYYCQYNGDHSDNESSFTEENSIYRYEKMLSGEFALKAVDADGNPWIYQDIDNNTFVSHMPTPIPAAGKVYSNILCDGTQSYSNKYNSMGAHTSAKDLYGYCTICGKQVSTPDKEIHIKDSLELIQFAYNVNRGADFSSTTVYLDNDINLANIDFPMIGNTTNTFKGTFDGQGHRIKNMTLNLAQGCVGFFGCAAGGNTIIKNLIIDSSCSVTSTGDHYGISGLLGGIQSASGSECNVTIENCGNEANVSGYGNVAGLLGGVFINDATVVNINNCYNIGNISGTSDSESGSIVGYARKHTNIRNTYNGGTVGGTDDWLTFAYTGVKGFDGKIENCYTTVTGDKTPNVMKILSSQITSGELCSQLNKNGNVFTQNVADTVTTHPVPGTDGLLGTTILHITNANELVAFANKVNAGTDYSSTIILLDSDIDLKGKKFLLIGGVEHPFKGVFNGQGHRIKNMDTSNLLTGTGEGFFGAVSGANTVIKNLIIDKSCVVVEIYTEGESYVGTGVAGLVGAVTSTSGTPCNITIENCGNEASVGGAQNVAGILGGVYNNDETVLTIKNCYNTGNIRNVGTDKASASICGYARNNYTITNCYNSGTLSGAHTSNILYCAKSTSSTSSATNCYDVNGSQTGVTKITAEQVVSGELCDLLNQDEKIFSQDVATETYPVFGTDGVTGITETHITNADQLTALATEVGNGNGSKLYDVYLDNDIDLSGVSFTPIGNTTNPFKGTFDGQGHSIKNMTLNLAQGCVGLFGCAAGSNTAIKNLIIDSSCSVTSTGDHYGISGLLGGVQSVSGTPCNITIENCGNEANISGYGNVAGLLGGVFINDATVVNINNCYNTGNISGNNYSASASIVGWTRKHANIRNTYNSGTVGGTNDWLTFACTMTDGFDGTIENCYTTVAGDKTSNVTKILSSIVPSGELCDLLNSNDTVFTQNITTDLHPIPGTDGLKGITVKYISDADSLVNFANSLNSGENYNSCFIYLASDIDLSGKTFAPIGNSNHPFMGKFDGRGYRIKNMTLNSSTDYQGFFGAVSGANCVVKNTIIDSSCSVTSKSGKGVAGLIGGVTSANGSVCNLTIENCGNEANVSGYGNVAGLLGGVYNNDATVVNINNCYNTGNISGNNYSASASIVGWTRKHANIRNTYNSGTVGGTNDWLTFACTMTDGFDGTIENCYTTVAGDKTANVTKIAAYSVKNGDLCNLLNKEDCVFTQTVGEACPVPGTGGLNGDPDSYWMEVSTAQEFKNAAEMTNINSGYAVRIRLAADIDLSSLSAISSGDEKGYLFSTNYHGIIDGNGHSLKNSTHCLFYRTSQATLKNITLEGFNVTDQTSLIARTSYSSNFDSITVKISSIKHTDDSSNGFGMIVGYSNCDSISYCSVEDGCSVYVNRQRTGGLVGESYRGSIIYSHNGATVTGDADYIGGIVGKSGDSSNGTASKIAYCLNTGTINGDDQCGGIAGQYYGGKITNCVNTGTISSKDGDSHDNTGGIIGKLCSAECDTCINFGTVEKAKSQKAQFAIYGGSEGTVTATGNEYYCNVKGKHFDTGMLYDDLMSGKYTLSKDWLYQDIDNNTFCTHLPTPIPAVGKVNSNILCDGTQSYSNKYNSTGAHTGIADIFGYCTICGKLIGFENKEIHIKDSLEFIQFAYVVNKGIDFSTSTVCLDNDINLANCDFPIIGRYATAPFRGTFDGKGHRIKNMALKFAEGGIGLFGVVSGTSTIKNVIIDSSCSVISTSGAGIAGLVGSIKPYNSVASNVTIENCGNEAAVTGYQNVAGILGGVYNNDNNTITIRNCYNTGIITNTKSDDYASASICGYAHKNYTIANCYGIGSQNGTHQPLYCPASSPNSSSTVTNCYDINGSQARVTHISKFIAESGKLCQLLNQDGNVFTQTIGSDEYPVPGTAGLTGDPDAYWKEVSTAEEFKNAVELTYVDDGYPVKIKQTADIDLSSLSAISSGDQKGYLFTSFQGKMDGQNFALKNCNHPLFYRASNAEISNIVIDGFTVTDATAIVARTSNSSTYDSITFKNSSLTPNNSGSNIAMIAGWSSADKYRYCTVEKECTINSTNSDRDCVGSIAGQATNGGEAYCCYNAATVTSKGEITGGIIGMLQDGHILNCLNTGTISGDQKIGGIAGGIKNTKLESSIEKCVNTGTVQTSDNGKDFVGGILGYGWDNESYYFELKYCFNYGWVKNHSHESEGAYYATIYGEMQGYHFYVENCYAYCKEDAEGTIHSVLDDNHISYKALKTGKIANEFGSWLYQDIDNNTFETSWPVPIAAAGVVYKNYLCDGTCSYSNKFQSPAAHTTEEHNGICTVCNANILHIKDANDLLSFVVNVNSYGKDYTGYVIYLDNDIDASNLNLAVGQLMIGGSPEHPFMGVFNGQGHRIKNLHLVGGDCMGLFGYVSGTSAIRNVIIDSSCSVEQLYGAGAAGLVGGVYPYDNMNADVTIENCGNEASITGTQNVAGILGGVYGNDYNTITIRNCYNTGAITNNSSSDESSASICGYARKYYTIANCYSIGSMTGKHSSNCLYSAAMGSTYTGHVTHCYDINGWKSEVPQITADDARFGSLCNKLNSDGNVFTQNLENDTYPVPGTEGLHYKRSMTYQWGTIVLPFDVDISDTTYCKYYQLAAVADTTLTLKQLTGTLKAGTPAMLRMNEAERNAETGKLELSLTPASSTVSTIINNPAAVDGLTLKGTYSDLEDRTQLYYIAQNKFWYADDPITIGTFRAYLDGTVPGVKYFSLFSKSSMIDFDPDGVEEVMGIEGLSLDNAVIYNLAGLRLNAPVKGQINIINGRKIFVK